MIDSKIKISKIAERQRVLLIPFTLVFFQIILCSCAAVQFKQGLLLKGEGVDSVESDASGNVDILRLKNPPMMLRIGQLPKINTLTVGPYVLVPLPVIPWPPGIISALTGGHPQTHSDDRFQIFITFSSLDRYRFRAKKFEFTPNNVELNLAGKKLNPILYTYKSYAYPGGYDQEHQRETTGCFSGAEEGHIYLHTDSPPPSNCEEMEIVLTFDVAYSSVTEAILNIGDIIVDGVATKVRSIPIKRNRFALWAGPIINS